MNILALPSMQQGRATAPASSTSSTGSGSSTTSGATLDSNSAESTFIKLLVTELQSQDPTQPMDPTQMVGQMFSMNQLQQLIDINQTLSTALGGGSSAGATPAAAVPSNMGTSLLQAATLPTSAAASYAQQLLTGAH
jgi:flagellar basal-body rod modification protein FlgD